MVRGPSPSPYLDWCLEAVLHLLQGTAAGLSSGARKCPVAPPCPDVHLSCPAASPVLQLDFAAYFWVLLLLYVGAGFFAGFVCGYVVKGCSGDRALKRDAQAEVAIARSRYGISGR